MDVTCETKICIAFGEGTSGATNRERAASSERKFVRSQDHLSVVSDRATGRVLTALEAYDAFGIDKLYEAAEYGTASLPSSVDEPAATIRNRRHQLGLTHKQVAQLCSLDNTTVVQSENSAFRTPIRALERISAALGLDERLIAFRPGSGGDDSLAVRLKTLGESIPSFSARTVLTLAEAAWVAKTQSRLEAYLTIAKRYSIETHGDSNYGTAGYPAWQHGYWLASKTRSMLGINDSEPIPSMRDLCSRLGFPVIQASLPESFAGATVANAGCRAIVVNTRGYNSNVWVRRATLSHELAHLLWDPDEHLQNLRVDSYDQIQQMLAESPKDYVESRANAFSIEFLAPADAVRSTFQSFGDDIDLGMRAVMEKFGISATAARYHVWNSIERSIPHSELVVQDTRPSDSWLGPENFTIDYFPLHSTPDVRRGGFSAAVAASEKMGLISEDTAAAYLCATAEVYRENRDDILDIFPEYKQAN